MTIRNYKVTAKIVAVGNSWALILPKPLCENCNWKKGMTLEMIYTQAGVLIPEKRGKKK